MKKLTITIFATVLLLALSQPVAAQADCNPGTISVGTVNVVNPPSATLSCGIVVGTITALGYHVEPTPPAIPGGGCPPPESPLHTNCEEGKSLTISVPVHYPSGFQVSYRWFRNGVALSTNSINLPQNQYAIAYTIPTTEAVASDTGVEYHFEYSLNGGGCTTLRQSARYNVRFCHRTSYCVFNSGGITATSISVVNP